MGPRKTTFSKKDCMTPQAMNDDKRLASARLAYSKVGTYWDEQSENKTRATWEMGRWRRGKWEREPCLSPAPARFSHFFYTFWLSSLNDFSPLSWEPGTGYHLYKSVPFTEKRPRRPETVIKDGFAEMEHEFLFVIFHPKKQDHLFRCSVAPGNFPLGSGPKKSCSIYFPSGFPGKFL